GVRTWKSYAQPLSCQYFSKLRIERINSAPDGGGQPLVRADVMLPCVLRLGRFLAGVSGTGRGCRRCRPVFSGIPDAAVQAANPEHSFLKDSQCLHGFGGTERDAHGTEDNFGGHHRRPLLLLSGEGL